MRKKRRGNSPVLMMNNETFPMVDGIYLEVDGQKGF